jgi:hypothetical protein
MPFLGKKKGMDMDKETHAMPQEAREALRKFAEQTTGWQVQDTHIKRIHVHKFSSRIRKLVDSEIRVGEEMDLNLANIPHESVFAIFESKDYLVVTPDHHSKTGATVYLFEPDEVTEVEKE